MFCVLLCDLPALHSAQEKDRENAIKSVSRLLADINDRCREVFAAGLQLTRENCLEGVLFSVQFVPMVIQELQRLFWSSAELTLRICAVEDSLTVLSTDSSRVDGPAYRRAKEELERLRRRKDDHWFQVRLVTASPAQPLTEGILQLLTALTEGWTQRQRELIWALPAFASQKQLAEALDINPSAVGKQLRSANEPAYRQGWAALEQYLAQRERTLIETTDDVGGAGFEAYYSHSLRQLPTQPEAAAHCLDKAIELGAQELGIQSPLLAKLYRLRAERSMEALSRQAEAQRYDVMQYSVPLLQIEGDIKPVGESCRSSGRVEDMVDYLLLCAKLSRTFGDIYRFSNQLDKAQQHYTSALATLDKALATPAPLSAVLLADILELQGALYLLLGQAEQARQSYLDARLTLGEDFFLRRRRCRLSASIARCDYALGRKAEAMELLSLTIFTLQGCVSPKEEELLQLTSLLEEWQRETA